MSVIVSTTNPRWCVIQKFYDLAYNYIDSNDADDRLIMYNCLIDMFGKNPTLNGTDIEGSPFRTIFESECGVFRIPMHLYLAAEPGKHGMFKISMEHAFPRSIKSKDGDCCVSEKFINIAKDMINNNKDDSELLKETRHMLPNFNKGKLENGKYKISRKLYDSFENLTELYKEIKFLFPDYFESEPEFEVKEEVVKGKDIVLSSHFIELTKAGLTFPCADDDIIKTHNCCIPKILYNAMCEFSDYPDFTIRKRMLRLFSEFFPTFDRLLCADAIRPGINYSTKTEHSRFICPTYLVADINNPVKLKENLARLFLAVTSDPQNEVSFDAIIEGYPVVMNKGFCLPYGVKAALMANDLREAYKLLEESFYGKYMPTKLRCERIYGKHFSYNETIYQYCVSTKLTDLLFNNTKAQNKYDSYEEVIHEYNKMFEPKDHIKLNPKVPLLREIEQLNLKIAELDKSK